MGLQYKHLSELERIAIEGYVLEGLSDAQIARRLGRHRSTIGRERQRGLWVAFGRYLAEIGRRRYAQGRVDAGRCRRKLGEDLGTPGWLHVMQGLRAHHSPQLIAGRLRAFDPLAAQSNSSYVSHETIYRAVYGLPAGQLRTELIRCLAQSRRGRRRRSRGRQRFTGIQNFTSIALRPPHVLDRLEPGHFEGDLMEGARGQSAIGVLVERTSRLVQLVQLDNAGAGTVAARFEQRLRLIPPALRKTLTYDRGTEMARHDELAKALGMHIYFCDPYSPWQRGTVENTNGLLRRYLPKGMDLSALTQDDLLRIERLLNDRPRRVLGYHTPQEVYDRLLAQLASAKHRAAA